MHKEVLIGILTTVTEVSQSCHGEWIVLENGQERNLLIEGYTDDTITVSYEAEQGGRTQRKFKLAIEEVS